MKVLRFNDNRIGVLKDPETVIDVSDLIAHRHSRGPAAIDDLIAGFDRHRPAIEKLAGNGAGIPLSSVRLLAPLERPVRVLAAYVNYLDRPSRTLETVPLEFFHKSPEIVGPEGTIFLPDIPEVREYHAEAEIAFVIGKHGKDVPLEKAREHIFGYVPFFDISARGLTRKSQLLPKGQDSFTVCGPWITTADEVADPDDLNVRSWVSGEARQDYNTGAMAHKMPNQVAWLSRFIQLHPGMLVATGTFHVGLGPINVGDTLEIEISGLGRARFFVSGQSPHKATGFQPGQRPGAESLVLTDIR